jgi:hypothetical protein
MYTTYCFARANQPPVTCVALGRKKVGDLRFSAFLLFSIINYKNLKLLHIVCNYLLISKKA